MTMESENVEGPDSIDEKVIPLLTDTAKPEIVSNASELGKIKVYRARWLMLLIFSLFCAVNSVQWIQYSIIANIVMRYYNIGSTAVDWTSMIVLVVYIVFIVPAAYIVQKWGLRRSVLLGCLLMTIGASLKAIAVAPHLFPLGFVGQTLSGVSQVFMLPLPPMVATVWFGPQEVSTACAIGVFANQLGVAAGFLMPPMMVRNHEDMDYIARDLKMLFYTTTVASGITLLLVLAFFKNEPPLPPSPAQALQKAASESTSGAMAFLASMKRLYKNKSYLMVSLAYGILVGVLNAISTMLNQMILIYFPGGEEFGGRVGLVLILAGMLGSVLFGVILDKTHKYKETTVVVYALTALGMLLFSLTLSTKSQVVVYLTGSLLGLFLGGYMPVGFELAVEVTYPEPEATTAGLLIIPPCVLGVGLTVAHSGIMASFGDLWANGTMAAALAVGVVVTALTPAKLRRLAANSRHPADGSVP